MVRQISDLCSSADDVLCCDIYPVIYVYQLIEMKVLIATCFESNEERVKFVHDAGKSRGYDVSVITSDFSHIRKQKRENIPEGFETVATRPYRKNLSIKRMYSHHCFAKDAFRKIEDEKPDLIWLMAPANYLIAEAKKYKENHKDVKLIIDIIDID